MHHRLSEFEGRSSLRTWIHRKVHQLDDGPLVRKRPRRRALSCGLNIAARNYGRWADLKRELIVLSDDLRDYEAAHGRVTEETLPAFLEAELTRGRAMTFSFSARGPEVEFKFRLRTAPPRVLISWGGGRNAAFDLDTMFCDYSD